MIELAIVGAVIVGLLIYKRQKDPVKDTSLPENTVIPPSTGEVMTNAFYGVGELQGVQPRNEDMVRENGEPVAVYRGGNNPYKPSVHVVDPELERQAAQIVSFSPAVRSSHRVF